MIKRGGLVRIEFKCRVIDNSTSIRPIRFGSCLHGKRWADPACRVNPLSQSGSTQQGE